MGTVELYQQTAIIRSHIIIYGDAATKLLATQIGDEIESMWNEPKGLAKIAQKVFRVEFRISALYKPEITDMEIYQNLDPGNNFFRIEEFANGNISFVDGIGCNSGYFKLENLYPGSTTAAHEYGHTIGLDHPENMDLRGKGVPGIMYPRGTLVDPEYQYDTTKPAGVTGGTMHPMHRKVLPADIESLKLQKLIFQSGRAVLGEFTNIWHEKHIAR